MAAKKTKEQVTEEVTEEVKAVTEEPEIIEKEEPTVITPEDKVKELEDKIKELQHQVLLDRADLENTKKRLEKERITERKYAGMSISKKLITPLDHFDLALGHEVTEEAMKNFVQGFKMIKDQIYKVLEEEGVSEIEALHEEYDPNFHQAIMTEKVDGTDPNIVIEVLQKGYMYKDRLIRPAIVKISE